MKNQNSILQYKAMSIKLGKKIRRVARVQSYLVRWTDFYRKRHYRESIVAFLTNATKKNATIVFVFQPKVEFAKLDFQKESNLLNNFEHVPRA